MAFEVLEPVLHNITPDRVLFFYRENDADSFDVAQYYKNARRLDDSQLVALSTSSDNIITESEFIETIEQPILAALNDPYTSAGSRDIWVLILGHHIPHGYWPDDAYDPYAIEPIAIASRLHRLGKSSVKHSNHAYDRRNNFKFFDAIDNQELYITAVIDAPTKEATIKLIDRSLDVDNMPQITGKLYLDPYGLSNTSAQRSYRDTLLEFSQNEALNLGIDISLTNEPSTQNYVDPTVSSLKNDSFYWGWFTPRYSQSLFLNQNERRVFLYNADEDSAADISADFDEYGSDPWCNLAILAEPGYAATAGAISAPGEDAYLRPHPFFETLHRGGTIGEAFLFSSPYVNWKIFLVGDPLMTVLFPVADLPDEQEPTTAKITYPNSETIYQVKEAIEDGLAYGLRQSNLIQFVLDKNVASDNFAEELYLLYGLAKWKNFKSQQVHNNLFNDPIQALLSYTLRTTGLNFVEWMSQEGYKTTELFRDALSQVSPFEISDAFIYPEGFWKYDFVYNHVLNTFENLHFELQLAFDEDFENIAVTVNSYQDIAGWQYEQNAFQFVQFPSSGFPSNFNGRRIRYNSPEDNYLTRTDVFYVRWRELNSNGEDLLI